MTCQELLTLLNLGSKAFFTSVPALHRCNYEFVKLPTAKSETSRSVSMCGSGYIIKHGNGLKHERIFQISYYYSFF